MTETISRPVLAVAPRTAPPSRPELQTTTRGAQLGGNRVLKVGVKKRFSEADLETLKPSMVAAELAFLLGHPAEFLNDYRLAARPSKKSGLTEEECNVRDRIRKEERDPAKREDLIKALYARSRVDREARLRECRRNIKTWLKTVRLYEIYRPWLLTLPPSVRAKQCRDMADGVARASANYIELEDRELERERARNRKELTRTARRLRKYFKWRGRTQGRGVDGNGFAEDGHGYGHGLNASGVSTGASGCGGSDGYRDTGRQPHVHIDANGDFDARANAEAELLIARSSWARGGTNAGIEIVQGSIEEQGDQWSVTEEYRMMKRLTEERQAFWTKRKSRAI